MRKPNSGECDERAGVAGVGGRSSKQAEGHRLRRASRATSQADGGKASRTGTQRETWEGDRGAAGARSCGPRCALAWGDLRRGQSCASLSSACTEDDRSHAARATASRSTSVSRRRPVPNSARSRR
jgi:hypothetical protein